MCIERGLDVWPTADIVPWDEFVERLYTADRQAGRLAGRWLSEAAAELVWQRIVRDDDEVEALLSPPGVARAARAAWRRLHDYAIPLEALDAADSPETAAFARWCRRYSDWLAAQDCIDPALASRLVHPVAAAPGIEIVGFDVLTPLQEQLLRRLADAGVDVRRNADARVAAHPFRQTCADAAGEIEAAARWAAARLHESNGARVAIVVTGLDRRRDEVRRIVERVLVPSTGLTAGPAPESTAFEIAAARPLAEQPLVAAALDLLAAFVGTPDLPALSRLLRSPFVRGASQEGPARARLDAHIRRFETVGLGLQGLVRLAAGRGCPELARVLDLGREVINEWPQKDLPSNCSKYIFDLLNSVGSDPATLDSVEHQAEGRWRRLLSEFGGSDEFSGRVTRPEAVGLLRDLATRVLFEPQELTAPLLIIDPDTCAGMHFDALWVCGLEATQWPPPAAPDPFLPRALQIRHGLPRASAELATRAARTTLNRLLCSAGQVVLSSPRADRNASLLPSPLLDGIEERSVAPGWTARSVARELWAARPDLEQRVDGRMPVLAGEDAIRGGARLLELQSMCPFRAQSELRLGASPLDESGPGLDAAERGTLVHAALAGFWRRVGDQASLLALDAAALHGAVRDAVTAALADARRTADGLLAQLLDLEAEWIESRVRDLIAADRERPPFAVVAIETSCTARIGALTLELRPDRVDRLADGSLAVVDYKTGSNAEPRAWLDERPRLPQLPAYVQALGEQRVGAVAFARLRSGATGYVGLARSAAQFSGLKEPESWEQLLADWRRRLEALAQEYESGDARLAPDRARACRYCHLGALCRIAEAGRDEAIEGPDDD